MSTVTTPEVGQYTEDHMKTLKDAAHIRQNPGMYVGNTGPEGLHHLVYEIVYNSVDEALAGYCKNITVVIHVDGSISVGDDGRGIPVGTKADTGKSTLEEALTIAGTSGKFDNAAYRVSAGLHGMGAKAMNALSRVVRGRGAPRRPRVQDGVRARVREQPAPGHRPGRRGRRQALTGTAITFKPDPEIFGGTRVRLREARHPVPADRVPQQAASPSPSRTSATAAPRPSRPTGASPSTSRS